MADTSPEVSYDELVNEIETAYLQSKLDNQESLLPDDITIRIYARNAGISWEASRQRLLVAVEAGILDRTDKIIHGHKIAVFRKIKKENKNE